MKYPLLAAAFLLGAMPAFAQTQPVAPKGATTIVVHSPDSAKVAYTNTVKALLAAGYGIDKNDKEALFVQTPAKTIRDAFHLTLRASVVPATSGSDISFRGQFTWNSAITIMAKTDKNEVEVKSLGGGKTPIQQMWNEMQQVAQSIYPAATMTFK